ncbi:hypothetical protein V1478_014605, partial [Vespula squamosa]
TDVERIIIVIGRNPLTRQKISLTSGFCRDDDLSQVVRPQRRRTNERTNERKNIRSYASCLELISRLLDRGEERGGRKIKRKRREVVVVSVSVLPIEQWRWIVRVAEATILSKREDQITPVHHGATLDVLGQNKREATIDSAIRNILND